MADIPSVASTAPQNLIHFIEQRLLPLELNSWAVRTANSSCEFVRRRQFGVSSTTACDARRILSEKLFDKPSQSDGRNVRTRSSPTDSLHAGAVEVFHTSKFPQQVRWSLLQPRCEASDPGLLEKIGELQTLP
jgi:hypothetical protein